MTVLPRARSRVSAPARHGHPAHRCGSDYLSLVVLGFRIGVAIWFTIVAIVIAISTFT